MAIKYLNQKVSFTGPEAKQLKEIAKELGMSVQDTFTGLMWEYVMKEARKGVFKRERTS